MQPYLREHYFYQMEKTVIITGGNDGIGFSTAKALAAKNWHVIIICRNEIKAKEAVELIHKETGNQKIEYALCDLSKQSSIKDVVFKIRTMVEKIDVLINNAGGTFSDFKLTEDGIEQTIALNHFAYHILTVQLLDLIKKAGNGRIINVSSGSHYRASLDFESFTKNKGYFILSAYAQSKLCNVLFTFELAERLKDTKITVNCLHPGRVKTDIGTKKTMNAIHAIVWKLLVSATGITVEEGAKTSIFLAESPEVTNITGQYFDKCKVKKPDSRAFNEDLRKQLWEITESLIHRFD